MIAARYVASRTVVLLWILTLILCTGYVFAADPAEHDRYVERARAEHKYVVRKECKPMKDAYKVEQCKKKADAQLNETLKAIKARYQ